MHLAITTDATEVLLHPHRRSNDTVPLLVQVHLTLGPKERSPTHLTSLDVSLHRVETMLFDKQFENNIFEPIRVSFDVAGQPLLPGVVHTWEARLDIPHTSPPYSVCPDAHSVTRTHQYLVASARYPSRLGMQRAKTARKDLYFVHQPAFTAADSDPYCYTHTQTGANEGIGPVLVGARSQHLTVGGTMRVQVQIPAPAESFQLRSIEFAVQQNITLRSRKEKGKEHVLPPSRLVLLHEDRSDVKPDGWLLRLPTCSMMRPSSVDDRRGIHVEHLFTARFSYNTADTSASSSSLMNASLKPYAYTLAWSIHIPSCALRWESITLPAYSQADPCPVPEADRTEIAAKSGRRLCVCGKERKELLAIESLMARIHHLPTDNGRIESLESQLADKLTSNYNDVEDLDDDDDEDERWSSDYAMRRSRRRAIKSMISTWSVDERVHHEDDARSRNSSCRRSSASSTVSAASS
ncbi:hypothetical protein OC842_006343 [Tilletia horrida]|uniref:Arrestin-like N-terminal domain-containing protein n=1 Tax=Tilletia horrida TaxID=155126 RepID=A0AAN6JHN8_9BASI|nr:hypothetical protein OC842_006343 [Tilletia horrida]